MIHGNQETASPWVVFPLWPRLVKPFRPPLCSVASTVNFNYWFPSDRFYANINVLSSIDCFPVTTPGLKLEMLRMKLFAASSDICIEAVSSLIWLLRPVSSVFTGGRRLLGTERLSAVTRPGLVSCTGAGEGRISPTGGEHLGGPELQPTQLHDTWVRQLESRHLIMVIITFSQELKRKQ